MESKFWEGLHYVMGFKIQSVLKLRYDLPLEINHIDSVADPDPIRMFSGPIRTQTH